MIIYLVLLISLVFIAPKQFGEGVNLTRTFSIFSRVKDYQDGLKLFLERPIIGYGYNRLRTVKKDYTSHSGSAFSSSYLTILVSAGVMGFISLIGLMRLIWTKTAGKYRSVLIFLATISFFDNVFLHPFILYLLFVNLADN
jgi:O-antigen ligase